MSGGVISGNSANGKVWSEGGGVRVEHSAVFTMSGGAITGNTVTGGESPASGGSIVRIDPENGGGTDDTLITVPGR